MSQTENEADAPPLQPQPEPSDSGDERIRKVYAKDLKNGEPIVTVFRAFGKERHTSRAGKTYLSLTLVDRTGEVDARIFENVDVADTAVADGDYLLVEGKVGSFHGKSQIVIDRLERLDPEPIDEKEFTFTKPPEPPQEEKEKEKERPRKSDESPKEIKEPKETREPKELKELKELKLPRRLQRLLSEPQLAQALDALLGFVDRLVEEKVAARLSGEKPTERPERNEKRPRGPKVEHRSARHETRQETEKPEAKHEAKPEPKRDPSLPEGLAFKPFSQLVGDPGAATGSTERTEG